MSRSSSPVTLPHTWRPFGARMMGTVAGAMVLILFLAVWIAWGPDVRARFTPFQKGTLVFLGLIALGVWYALMRSRVTATEAGLTVVNGYRTRSYEWSQVLAVNLRRGAPWAGFDLADGTSISLIAIQGSDGQRAINAVRELRRLVEENSPVERDD
ncbi:PH domain-containing protein [Marmoricola sp. RAF53]|uniref:PH domain-containing protein n=1 Tax=Marmoricola sp. RAF53 TaxID=3233059 RepID=UPI003F9CDAC7